MEYPYLTDEEKRILREKGELNGCGRKGWVIQPPYGIFFEASCDWHDFNYWKGGTEYDRMNYDIGFFKAMLRDVFRAPWYTWVKYLPWTVLYYIAVRVGGNRKKSFHYGEQRTIKDIYE